MYDVQWDSKQFGHAVDRLKMIPRELRGEAGRSALRAAARVVRDKAQQNAARLDDPKTAQSISKNISARFGRKYYRSTGDLMFRVGVLGGARNYEAYGELTTGESATGNPGGDTFYWRFVEFGTERARAQPFMQPALESTTSQATDKFASTLNRQIDLLLKKAQR